MWKLERGNSWQSWDQWGAGSHLYYAGYFQTPIFPNVSNKIRERKNSHTARFPMPFHMEWSILWQSFASKTIEMKASLLKNFNPSKRSLATKQTTLYARPWKTEPENDIFTCVASCLSSFMPFERCKTKWTLKIRTNRKLRLLQYGWWTDQGWSWGLR